MAFLFYWVAKETPPTPYCELKPAVQEEQQAPLASDKSSSEMLHYFKGMSIAQLVSKLSNTQLVENGYTQRDLALAALVTFHHFDLSRALLGFPKPEQERKISFGVRPNGKPAEAIVFPGLTEEQYQAIIHFANAERWPLTGKGLFLLIKRHFEDASLADAFFLTPEFLTIETLFNRSDVVIDKNDLLKMLCEGTWQMLADFDQSQRYAQDLSAARRQKFLLNYIEHKSKNAAYIMLKTDGEFALKKLDDDHVLMMLNLLTDKTPLAEQFALSLLISPRRDSVWKMAASRLYEYAGEAQPEKFQHHAAVSRFVSQNTIIENLDKTVSEKEPISPPKKQFDEKIATVTTAAANSNDPFLRKNLKEVPKETTKKTLIQKRDRLYVVQEGDSLWKISKRFKVDVNVIRQKNQLDSDFLKPGTPLRIP